MSWLEGSRTRLRLLFGRRAAESRMDTEIRFHLDMETDKHRRAGFATGDARRRALVAFGGAGGLHACAVAELAGGLEVASDPQLRLAEALRHLRDGRAIVVVSDGLDDRPGVEPLHLQLSRQAPDARLHVRERRHGVPARR